MAAVQPSRYEATSAWLQSSIPVALQEQAQLRSDSRAVRKGDVLLAYPGARSDGRRFIPAGIEAGASAVLWDDAAPFEWNTGWSVPNRAEQGLKAAAGFIAAAWYGYPAEQLRVVGVTGTSGKSSCAWWIAQAMSLLGLRCALAGTLGMGFVNRGSTAALHDTGKTTPDAVEIQAGLRGLVEQGAQALAMEVSSIGLVEGRVNGMKFDIALFTNLSRDHLDYHGSMSAYEAAKVQLFGWPRLAAAVINIDDACGARFVEVAAQHAAVVLRYSASGAAHADLRATQITYSHEGMSFVVHGSFGQRPVKTSLIGAYNVENLLGVLGVLLVAGHDVDAALGALARLVPVPGRLETVNADHTAGPLVLVDYAHKPDALEKVLTACQPLARARGGRLVLVFGCGGDRDRGKRPMMGAIAERLADRVVVTSDNPRSEDPLAIIADITGALDTRSLAIEPDRQRAITEAITRADRRDVILIAGKGHETYQEVAGQRLPFSDIDVASAAMAGAGPC